MNGAAGSRRTRLSLPRGCVMNEQRVVPGDVSGEMMFRLLNLHTGVLTQRFGAATAAVMRREMLQEYRALIPGLPDIGGRSNPEAMSMVLAPWALALYRVVRRHGGSVEDAGEVIHYGVQKLYGRIPQPVRRSMGRSTTKERAQAKVRWFAENHYPDNWVYEFVDGDGQGFDFGLDVTQCALVNYLHAQGADELTPYLCDLDYVTFAALGVGLTRTKTLAWGCDRCDFRVTNPGKTTSTWPPSFSERACGVLGAPATASTGSTFEPTTLLHQKEVETMSTRLYTRSVTVDASVERVFDYIKDPGKSWVAMGTKIHDIKGTPLGVGSTFEWEDKMFGFRVSGTNEITEFLPNERIVITASKGFIWNFDVEPVGDGTKLTLGMDDVTSNRAKGAVDAALTKLSEHDLDVWLNDVKTEVETGVPRHRGVERHLMVTRAVTVSAPIEKVYAFLTDPANTLGQYPGTRVTELAPRPGVVGTTCRWHSHIVGVPASVKLEYTAAVPSDHVSMKSTSGFVQTWAVEPVDSGTKLTLKLENELPGPLGAVARSTMLRLEDRAADEWMERIATLVEAQAGS